jgi:hypothetical protein
MSAVIDMSAWKAAHGSKPDRPASVAREPSVYCCLRCYSDLFRILESGVVRCGKCMSEIRNLRAT